MGAGHTVIAQWLRRLADYLDPPVITPQPDRSPLLARVRALIEWAEPMHIDGEARCHQVYARLLKEYPSARKRDLRYAIEQVLQEMP